MSNACAECGADLGGLTGSVEMTDAKVEKLREWEVDVPTPICAACFGRVLDGAQARLGSALGYPEPPPAEFLAETRKRRLSIELVSGPPLDAGPYENLGLLTGHAIIGTGPLTEIASTLTDAMGINSKSYQEKFDQGVAICLDEVRTKALRKGATLVANLQLSWSELTAGHGMLLVAMAGTALRPRSGPRF